MSCCGGGGVGGVQLITLWAIVKAHSCYKFSAAF